MQRDQLIELLDRARSADATCGDRDLVVAAIDAATRLAAWCESQRLACTQALQTLVAAPEQVLAGISHTGPHDADRTIQRAHTTQTAPPFATALAHGRVTAGHLDQLGHTLRRLDPDQRATLLADTTRLVTIAATTTPDEFARTLRREERRLTTNDGTTRLQHQQRSVRLRNRIDLETGMHVFTLTLDPLTGLQLHNKVHAATEALFHDHTPHGCPTDPLEKQAFLRAHALLDTINSNGIRLARPEIIVVVDASTSDQPPVIDWGLPVELPERVLHHLWPHADLHGIVIHNGIVLHAPGQLDLGRTTRLANRAQRRALRALYPTCALPHCTTRFDLCTIHHITWWRNGGRTDLNNLLPICTRHHHKVHDSSWTLTLHPDRTLYVQLPDGTTMTTGPPSRAAA